MRKKIGLFILMVMCAFIFSVGPVLAGDESSVCPECDSYTHSVMLPYLASGPGWWNGVAVTNPGYKSMSCRIDYISENAVNRFEVARKSVFSFVADVTQEGYAKVFATGPGTVTLMTGNGDMMQGFCFELVPIPVDLE